MMFTSETVALNLVDIKDATYQISTDDSIDSLIDSIKHLGLLSPPILKNNNGAYTIISGFKRISAVRCLEWPSIEARVVNSDISDLQCVKLSIADNLVNRQLNFIEQAKSISMLSKYFNDIDLIKEAQIVGLNVNSSLLGKLKELMLLSSELQRELLSGTLSLTIALELGKMDKLSSSALIHIYKSLKPTFNIQKEILTTSKEIALVENVSVNQLLCDHFFSSTINNGEFSRNQKIQKIRYKLKQMRFPVISRFEENYNKLLNQLNLPDNIKLIPPENFEGDAYSIVFGFKNIKEFKFAKKILDRLDHNSKFEIILKKEIADH